MSDTKYTVIFRKPYTFEKKVYPSIDLSGMEDLTAEDVFAAYAYNRKCGGSTEQPELSPAYLLHLAASAAGVPIEFMEGLPAKEAMVVRYAAVSFFLADGSDDTPAEPDRTGEGSECGSGVAVPPADA